MIKLLIVIASLFLVGCETLERAISPQGMTVKEMNTEEKN